MRNICVVFARVLLVIDHWDFRSSPVQYCDLLWGVRLFVGPTEQRVQTDSRGAPLQLCDIGASTVTHVRTSIVQRDILVYLGEGPSEAAFSCGVVDYVEFC